MLYLMGRSCYIVLLQLIGPMGERVVPFYINWSQVSNIINDLNYYHNYWQLDLLFSRKINFSKKVNFAVC